MSEVIQSLFGINPTDILAQRELMAQKQAMQYAQMEPMQQAMYGANLAGNRIGGAVGGLLGAQDPELQRVAQRQSLASQIDWSNPDSIKKAAALAAKSGDTRAAMELIQRADSVTDSVLKRGVQQSQIVKNLREKQSLSVEEQVFKSLAAKSSPASVKAALDAGGDISLLDVPENVKISEMGRQLIEAGFKPGTPEFQEKMGKYVNAKIDGTSKGHGNVTVNLNKDGTPIDPKKTAEAAGKPVGEAIAGIEVPYAALDSIQAAATMVDQGIFSGFWGKSKMNVRKAFGENDPKVVNTEQFLSYIGDVVLPRMKELGGNDSNEELKYMQKVLAGDISLEADTIKKVLTRAEEKIKRNIERTQRQSKAAAQGTPAPLDPGPRRESALGTKENPIKLK